MVIPLEEESDPDPDPPALRPPPHPDHTNVARQRTMAPANLAREDFAFPIISDPLS
jgi:hypothetical protein